VVEYEDFVANLVVTPLDIFDAIFGIDWLSQYQAIISCFQLTAITISTKKNRNKHDP
jgi:hypothetical protein